jgi:3-hydroxyisobutyrate dehydrogenase-like beta-hydroxyacid dehydrogenase
MRVGFIGCGTMGEHMARNIAKGGHELSVFDVNPEPVARLAKDGASVKDSPRGVAEVSEAVVMMVVNDGQVRDVIAGENGILDGLAPGGLVIVMSTVSPGVCVDMSRVVVKAGSALVDAPVVLSQPAAIAGTLGIYVGGPEAACERARPVLSCMGKNIIRMGDVGTAMAMKLCHNMMTAIIVQAVSETLVLGRKAGLDIEDMVTAISYGGGQNFFLDSKAATIKARDFTPRFSLANAAKDVGLALAFAENCGVSLPAAGLVKTLQTAALAVGLGQEDFSATIKVTERLAGLDT